MPARAPQHRAAGWQPRAQRERERKAAIDRRRKDDPGRTLARTAAWRALRHAQLTAHPLCQCEDCGEGTKRVTRARVVDHIQPHRGDESLFFDPNNLRSMAKACHDRKTATVDTTFSTGGRAKWRPDWLRPSRIPLVIVCGPPASGKTQYARERAGSRDLIIDLDAIASRLAGTTEHGWSRQWLDQATRERNELLGMISDRRCRWPRAWLILSEPEPQARQWWVDKLEPETVVVLEVSADECLRRIQASEERMERRDAQYHAVGRWWERYGRRDGDEVVRQQASDG